MGAKSRDESGKGDAGNAISRKVDILEYFILFIFWKFQSWDESGKGDAKNAIIEIREMPLSKPEKRYFLNYRNATF